MTIDEVKLKHPVGTKVSLPEFNLEAVILDYAIDTSDGEITHLIEVEDDDGLSLYSVGWIEGIGFEEVVV